MKLSMLLEYKKYPFIMPNYMVKIMGGRNLNSNFDNVCSIVSQCTLVQNNSTESFFSFLTELIY